MAVFLLYRVHHTYFAPKKKKRSLRKTLDLHILTDATIAGGTNNSSQFDKAAQQQTRILDINKKARTETTSEDDGLETVTEQEFLSDEEEEKQEDEGEPEKWEKVDQILKWEANNGGQPKLIEQVRFLSFKVGVINDVVVAVVERVKTTTVERGESLSSLDAALGEAIQKCEGPSQLPKFLSGWPTNSRAPTNSKERTNNSLPGLLRWRAHLFAGTKRWPGCGSGCCSN